MTDAADSIYTKNVVVPSCLISYLQFASIVLPQFAAAFATVFIVKQLDHDFLARSVQQLPNPDDVSSLMTQHSINRILHNDDFDGEDYVDGRLRGIKNTSSDEDHIIRRATAATKSYILKRITRK